ncbi:hypothetical protein [Flagellimonas eckloniae]|uniref:Bacterial Pleckstrin homology domain-containing protein n=1 Tax=Flagellimonas eckloniae TaxID=346185 RepID=A0A0Q1BYM5_9FLAO|nr:hypothetical protein [Allomuricauda eckloniae]KQC29838.1 hypothetical protein AAY42_08045 [Allomuricauda eckloniae]
MNSSVKNYQNLNTKHKKIIFYALIGVLTLTIGPVGIGYTENDLILKNGQLEITGLYGEEISPSEIKSIELIDKRPSFRKRINGFSTGNRKKGYFRTNGGEKIKAIINSNTKPWILITKESGDKIYFSSGGKSNGTIYLELKKTLPNKT